MNDVTEFIDAMRAAGCGPAKESEIVADDVKRRYQVENDKRGKKNGVYRLKTDGGFSVGWFQDFKQGETHKYHSQRGEKMTPEQRAAYRARMDADRKAQEEARERDHEEAAAAAKAVIQSSVAAQDHPYLKRKKIQPFGARIDDAGNLIIPRYGLLDGKLWSYQEIDKAGKKKFQYNGRSSGTYFPMANKSDDKTWIVIAEGYATGASVREGTARPIRVAFTAGNLEETAVLTRRKYPEAHILLAADNDQFTFKNPRCKEVEGINAESVPGDDVRWTEWRNAGYLHNAGVEKAQAAAYKVGGRVIWPEFLPEDMAAKPTDWNDFANIYGVAALREKFQRAITEAIAESEPCPEMPEYDSIPDHMSPDVVPDYETGITWEMLVKFKDKQRGELHKDHALHNAEILLTHKPPMAGCFVYDEFVNKPVIVKPMPREDGQGFKVREMNNQDIVRAQIWLEGQGVGLSKGAVKDVLELACMNNNVNPAIDYLDRLKWDGTPRLDSWLTYYMGAEDQPADYLAKVGSCWLIAAVRRIYKPGTPFHHMLVLEGGQGSLKSTGLKTLATFGADTPVSYFSDRITFDMIDRPDFGVHANGNVILEFQELSGMGKKDRNKIKQWITLECDEYRKAYDHLPTKFPRKFVLAGTTNDKQYLNDPTGDRRFWPVTVGAIDVLALEADKEQLWAEAVARHKSGEKHYIEPDDPVYKLMQNEQSARYNGDPWDDLIEGYVATLHTVTVDEIFSDLLKIEKQHWDRMKRARIVDILTRCGFESKVVREPGSRKTMRKWIRMAQTEATAVQQEEIAF